MLSPQKLNQVVVLLIFGTSYFAAAEEAPLVAVYAIRGQTVRLPCNLTSAPEDPVILVLWYKNGTKTPVFSVDLRSRSHQESSSTRSGDIFGGRARFQKEPWNWALVVQEVEYSDQGEYRCRLDFQSSPTHNARVHLHVVDEPHHLRIYSLGGAIVEGEASVQEGHPLTLSCRATGGEPLPNVTWWSGPVLLDAEVEERQKVPTSTTVTPGLPAAPYVTNILRIESLTQSHLTQNLTCLAANTPVLRPLTASVVLRQTASDLHIAMDAPTGKLSGGHEYDVKCEASGVRPPPILTWWLRGKHLTRNIDMQNLGPDSTVSLLRLLTTPGDDGGLLECRASAPTLPHLQATDSTKLTIFYVPEAAISIEGVSGGEPGSLSGLREGNSATLTCVTRANPPAYNLTFMFNGRPLHRPNVVASGWSLTLLELQHHDSGLYTCLASNSEGDGQSNAVALHIDYSPVCAWESHQELLAAVGEKVKMGCVVKASPNQVTFDWKTTHKEAGIHHQDKGLHSSGWVMAVNVTDGSNSQRAECIATNDVGRSLHPCVFTIALVEPPGQLVGCYFHDVTTDSAAVTCSPGSVSSKLPQLYHIEVRENSKVVLTQNTSEPRFSISTLAPGRDYVLAMYASHQKGRGPETTLLLKTHTPKAEEVAPERVSINLNNEVKEELQPPSDPAEESVVPVSAVVAGVVGVVVGLAIVVAAIVTCRARRSHANSPGKNQQFHHASHDSLLELPQGTMYQSCTRHPSRELLTTFSPGPVVVTQVTSGRSSMRSSPLARRSSTRSAPGGASPRRHRPRTPSCRGGPVHVVEVEADNITTPRVEIESPSKSLSSIMLSLRGDTAEGHHSPPLSLRCEPSHTKDTSPQATNDVPQNMLPTDFQLHPTSTSHLSPQTYATSPIQALPQPIIIDPVHSAPLHAESQINTVSYTTPHISLTTQTGTVPQTLAPSHIFTTTPHTYDTAPQICTAPQVHTVTQDITSQVHNLPQIQNTPQIHIESGDHLSPHVQETPKVLRVHEPLMHQEQSQQQAQDASVVQAEGEVTPAPQHHPTTPITIQRSSPDTGLIKFYPTFRYLGYSLT